MSEPTTEEQRLIDRLGVAADRLEEKGEVGPASCFRALAWMVEHHYDTFAVALHHAAIKADSLGPEAPYFAGPSYMLARDVFIRLMQATHPSAPGIDVPIGDWPRERGLQAGNRHFPNHVVTDWMV